jgi:excisionase family DNA binding protein
MSVVTDLRQNISIREAAAIVGVSSYTLRTWLRQRRLAHLRVGRRIVIAPHDLDKFLQAARVEAR